MRNMKSWKANTGALLTFATILGCGSGKTVTVVPDPSLPTGLPTPQPAGAVNTYSAAQSPGTWTLTLDNTKDAFSYEPITYPLSPDAPVTGSLQGEGGFLSLGGAGLAIEVPGRIAVLRPGDATTSPVIGVPQTSCYAITGKLRFQYIAMYPGPQNRFGFNSRDPLGYGSIVASTDTTGANWQFENLQGNVVLGPTSFTETCAAQNGQAEVGMSDLSLLSDFWATTNGMGDAIGPLTITTIPAATQSGIWIGPSGFFVADQSDPTQLPSAGTSVAGMAEPAAQLTTTAVAAAQYLGFLYEAPVSIPGLSTTTGFTAPVSFGPVASSGTTMTGGIFPNDDVTGTANSDTQVNLGKQDSILNGLYSGATITVLDPAQNCANFPGSPQGFSIPVTTGLNDQGYVTCTFPAVAIAGNPDGKYAIFVNSYNWAAALGGVPMQMYLFQQ